MSAIHYNHFICMSCSKYIETYYFYPDSVPICEECRLKEKVLSKYHYDKYEQELLK